MMSATRAALAATAAGLRSESRRTAAPSSVSPTSAAIRRLSARMLAGGACLPQSGASSRSTDGTVLDWRQKLSRRRAGIRGWAHGDFPEARLTLLHLFKAANAPHCPQTKLEMSVVGGSGRASVEGGRPSLPLVLSGRDYPIGSPEPRPSGAFFTISAPSRFTRYA